MENLKVLNSYSPNVGGGGERHTKKKKNNL